MQEEENGEKQRRTLYKPSIFSDLFVQLKICDIRSILNVKR